MSGPPVSIILAPHNGMDHIAQCLDSLAQQEYRDFEIIVVDNASSDGTVEFLHQHHPDVKVIRSNRNLAYAAGNNLGASKAKGAYLLFLNHDTLVTEGFLSELLKVMQSDPEIGIAQSRIMMARDRGRVDSLGAYLTRSGMWVHPLRGEGYSQQFGEPFDILGACGACLLVRREVFFELGGFDPEFVIYFEDADLSLRTRLSGRRVVAVPSSVIFHWGGVTTGKLPSTFTVFHSFKNRLCLMIKNLNLRDLLVTMPIHIALCLLAIVAYTVRLKPRSAIAIASAILWNARNLAATLRMRGTVRESSAAGPTLGYEDLVRPLPLSYFLRTSLSYLAQW